MDFKSKSKIRDEKRAKRLADLEALRLVEQQAEEENFAPIDAIIEAIDNLITVKIDGYNAQDERIDLREAIVNAIKSIK